MELRPYQTKAIDGVRQALRVSRSVLLTAPTGSGKTAMASFMTKAHVERGGRVFFFCHRRELIDQTSATFDRAGIRHNVICSGYQFVPKSPVQICSVQTMINRLDRIAEPTLVIWDECHHVGAKTWAHMREQWVGAMHVGLTATPQRLDGKGLGSWFERLVLGPTVGELIESRFLSNYEIYAPVQSASYHMRAGDFVKEEMELALGKGEILGGIVDQWRKRALGKKTICFAISVKHSQAIVAEFRSSGISAVHLDAKSKPWDRRAKLQAFARGDVSVISNVDLFGEGFDLAANSGMDCNIEAVIQARPTASLALHLQQVGRGLRPKNEPCIILDHAGNTVRHGFPDDEREWSLEGSDQKPKETANTKTCPSCFFVCKSHVKSCPACGFLFMKTGGRKIDEVDGELVKLSKKDAMRMREIALLADLRRIEMMRGLKPGWADRRHAEILASK